METRREYILNVAAQTAGRVCSVGASLAVFVLVARVLGPDLLGKYTFFLAYLGLAAMVAEFGTTAVLARELPRRSASAESYWGSFQILRFVMSLTVAVVAVVTAYFARRDLFGYLLAGTAVLPFIASRFFDPVFQVYNRPWFSFASMGAYAAVFIAGALVAVQQGGLAYVVAAYVVAHLAYAMVALGLSRRLIKPIYRLGRASVRQTLHLALPIGVSSLFTLINSRADTFMIAYLRSDQEVGFYNAAYRFLEAAAVFATVAMNPIIPIFSRKAASDRDGLKRSYTRVIEVLGISVLPVGVILHQASPFVIHLLFGDGYQPSAAVLEVLAPAGVLVFFCLINTALCLALGIVHFGYWNTAAAAGINILLNLAWIPRYGIVGAAYAALISQILLLSVTIAYLVRHLGNCVRWRSWVRIVAANAVLAAVLSRGDGGPGPLVIFGALATYVVLLFAMRLLPPKVFATVIR